MTPIFRLFFSIYQLVTCDAFGNVGTLVMLNIKNSSRDVEIYGVLPPP